MNKMVANSNSNDLAQLINYFPKDAFKSLVWIPVTAIAIKSVIDSIMAKDYELYGNLKEGKFVLSHRCDQFVE